MIRALAFAAAIAWSLPAAALSLDIRSQGEDTWIVATGSIEPGDADTLFDWTHDEDISRLVIDSPGGDLAEAIRIGRLVRSFDIETVVPNGGRCLSACFFAFAGGTERIAAADARLGVHQFSGTGAGESADDAQATAQSITADLLAFVTDMGINPAVLAAALRTPPDSMHIFSAEELAGLSIIALRSVPAAPDKPCPFPESWGEIRDDMGLYPQCGDRIAR